MSTEPFLTQSAIEYLDEHVTNKRAFDRIEDCIHLIGEFPYIGRAYDPLYAAARPPINCRCLPVGDTPYALYYYLAPNDQPVIFYIENQAMAPVRRFHDVVLWPAQGE